jgi:hypothetical protein
MPLLLEINGRECQNQRDKPSYYGKAYPRLYPRLKHIGDRRETGGEWGGDTVVTGR